MGFGVCIVETLGIKYDVGPEESADRPFGCVLRSTNSRKSSCREDLAELDVLPALPWRYLTCTIVEASCDLHQDLKDVSKPAGIMTQSPSRFSSTFDFSISLL